MRAVLRPSGVRGVFFLSLIVCGSAYADGELKVDPQKPYRHAPSGFSYPVEVAGMKRGSGQQYDAQARDVSFGYNDAPIGLSVTVYAYPARELNPVEEFKSCIGGILGGHKNVKLLTSREATFNQGDRRRPGYFANFSFTGEVGGFSNLTMRSQLYLVRVGNSYIKYRMTFPEEQAKNAEHRIEKFMTELKLPPEPRHTPSPKPE